MEAGSLRTAPTCLSVTRNARRSVRRRREGRGSKGKPESRGRSGAPSQRDLRGAATPGSTPAARPSAPHPRPPPFRCVSAGAPPQCWDPHKAAVFGKCIATKDARRLSAGDGGDLTVTGTAGGRTARRATIKELMFRKHWVISAGSVVYTPRQRRALGAVTVSVLQARKQGFRDPPWPPAGQWLCQWCLDVTNCPRPVA